MPDVLLRDGERGRAVRGQVQVVRRLLAGGQVDRLEMCAREDRRVDEHDERRRCERDRVGGLAHDRQSGSVLPSGRQLQRRREHRRVVVRSPGIDEHGPPVDDEDLCRGRRPGVQRRDVVEGDLDRSASGRHVARHAPHLRGDALPRERAACRRDLQADEVGHGARRAVLARNPLRVDERQCPRRRRDGLPDVENPPRRVTRVDGDRDRRGGLGKRCQCSAGQQHGRGNARQNSSGQPQAHAHRSSC